MGLANLCLKYFLFLCITNIETYPKAVWRQQTSRWRCWHVHCMCSYHQSISWCGWGVLPSYISSSCLFLYSLGENCLLTVPAGAVTQNAYCILCRIVCSKFISQHRSVLPPTTFDTKQAKIPELWYSSYSVPTSAAWRYLWCRWWYRKCTKQSWRIRWNIGDTYLE